MFPTKTWKDVFAWLKPDNTCAYEAFDDVVNAVIKASDLVRSYASVLMD